jgi:hypothetical protein
MRTVLKYWRKAPIYGKSNYSHECKIQKKDLMDGIKIQRPNVSMDRLEKLSRTKIVAIFYNINKMDAVQAAQSFNI